MNSETLQPAVSHPRCTVRMYCHGLGDCFLIRLQDGEQPFWILIDGGLILGTQEPDALFQRVFEDVRAMTGGKVDLHVVTHEHWDHVSGFVQAETEYRNLGIQKVWYAWTEDPNDAVGVELKRTRSKAAFAIEDALEKMNEKRPLSGAVKGLMGAFGLDKKGRATTSSAMQLPGSLAAAEYRRPGETVNLAGVRFHILGPPRDERLFRSDPSKKHSETFEFAKRSGAFAIGRSMGIVEAVEGLRNADDNDLTRPFDVHLCQPIDRAEELYPNYKAEDWRTIDDDWEDIVGQLALQLDSDTNNTSLAFAIEFPDSGKVLLFPGDAQVGSWLSWHDLEWKFKLGNGDDHSCKVVDLLNRTVLYKVGHHGSHNATLKDKGLMMMISPELHAMVPVNEVMAKKKKWSEMPLPSLLAALDSATKGRFVRADDPHKFNGNFRVSQETFADGSPLFVELDIHS